MSMTTPRVTVPVEPTNEMIRTSLAVEFPATYRDFLRHPDDGPKSAEVTEQRIARERKRWSAMLSAAPAPEGGAGDEERLKGVVSMLERVVGPTASVRIYEHEAKLILVALATREEAPAEAGEDVNWKAEYEAACAARISDRQKSQEVINERDKWVAELLQERAALRAQPPAREDAQPVAWRFRDHPKSGWVYTSLGGRHDGCEVQSLFLHPAPDALRDAERYRYLRSRDPGPDGALPPAGLFIGRVPDNVILTEGDADAAIDQALGALREDVDRLTAAFDGAVSLSWRRLNLARDLGSALTWALAEIDGETKYEDDGQRENCRDKADQALAALQAEQKGGA